MSDIDGIAVGDMEPLYTLTQQEFYALRRNVAYAPLLRSLLDGPRTAASTAEGLAAAMLEQNYGWTRRGAEWRWEITDKGRDAIEAYEAKRVVR